jgi:hypothetical protein
MALRRESAAGGPRVVVARAAIERREWHNSEHEPRLARLARSVRCSWARAALERRSEPTLGPWSTLVKCYRAQRGAHSAVGGVAWSAVRGAACAVL